MKELKRLNETIEEREAMIDKILYSGKFNLRTDREYDKKERELNKKGYRELVKICEQLNKL